MEKQLFIPSSGNAFSRNAFFALSAGVSAPGNPGSHLFPVSCPPDPAAGFPYTGTRSFPAGYCRYRGGPPKPPGHTLSPAEDSRYPFWKSLTPVQHLRDLSRHSRFPIRCSRNLFGHSRIPARNSPYFFRYNRFPVRNFRESFRYSRSPARSLWQSLCSHSRNPAGHNRLPTDYSFWYNRFPDSPEHIQCPEQTLCRLHGRTTASWYTGNGFGSSHPD